MIRLDRVDNRRRSPTGRRWAGPFAAVAALVLLGGSGIAAAAPSAVETVTSLPAPDVAADAGAAHPDYVIGPLDTLEIRVYPEADLGGEYQVDVGGKIEMPLAGAVEAASLTPRQLGAEIEAALKAKYFESPSVAVEVKSSATQKYTVTGAVQKPGTYQNLGGVTLMQAIADAGGISQLANARSVVIYRTVNRRRVGAIVDLPDVEHGKIEDPKIYAGDLIMVSTSRGRALFHSVLEASPLLFLLRP